MDRLKVNQRDVILDFFSPIIDTIADKVVERVLGATSNKEPKYYTRKEVAGILHITLPTLSRLTNNGVLTCKRIGSRILYDANTIDDAIRSKVIFKYRRAK
ncbi:MAG: helix-turn-helix domain-containing protein [Tannerellaceae bacterium]|jgi:hypothetical protein|nr:helix-turn-helix domain-containing protein [Tannerellaceae bacterium]